MAAHVEIEFDKTGPAGVTISAEGGALYATAQVITVTIATTDPDTTGYEMKVYGDVDESYDANVQDAKADSSWIAFNTSKTIKLAAVDGAKTVKVTVRDDVWNESSEATDAITLDTTVPVVTVQSGPTPPRISKIEGKDESSFVWQSDVIYDEFKVKRVPATDSIHTAGTQVPSTGGSTNVAGSTPDQPADTNVTTAIDGDDLETAGVEGDNIVKVFVKNNAGVWSL